MNILKAFQRKNRFKNTFKFFYFRYPLINEIILLLLDIWDLFYEYFKTSKKK